LGFYKILIPKEQKLNYLTEKNIAGVDWQVISPNDENVWLTEGLHSEFDEFFPLGSKEVKKAKTEAVGVFFKFYGLGVSTNRDAWAYNFNQDVLAENMQRTIDSYNEQVDKWVKRDDRDAKIDDFVLYDDKRISWDGSLKDDLKRGKKALFSLEKIRQSLYRPFTKSNFFLIERSITEFINSPKFFPHLKMKIG